MKTSAFVGTIAATFLIVSAAHAAKKNYQVDLSPDQENVTPDLGNADPTGSAKFTYDDQTKQLCGEITYTGLTGAAMGIHIHQAPPGNPEGDGVAPAQGKLIIPVGPSPVKFNFTLPQAFADSLDADELYANIHTVKNDKGEIRSQTPWDQPANATAVVCPPPTNPDGGVSTSSSSGGTDAGSTSSSSSSSSSGDTSSSSSSSSSGGGNDASTSKSTPPDAGEEEAPPAESGCNTSGAPTNALSFAFVVGAGIAALSSRMRRKKKKL